MTDPTFQHHDWNPGIADNGLFWTIPISPGAIKADPASGRATFRAEALKLTDFVDFFTAVGLGDKRPVPGRASFEVTWAGGGDPQHVRDETFGFEGDYVSGAATISFVASDDGTGVTYRSDPDGQTNPGPPAVGVESNGSYFVP